ncbi:MAG: biotin--[acetyl-CoA-carboxylase] ligase [Pseudomonadota bacterium]
MRRALELLSRLGDGTFCPGRQLADEFGVSRAAIWNLIRTLRSIGVEIDADRTRGYRVAGGYQALSAEGIMAAIATARIPELPPKIHVEPVCTSTNTELLRLSERQSIHQTAFLADYQSAGRGRRGDRWVSPPGSGLYCSLGWHFESIPATFSALSLVVGLVIAEALESLAAIQVNLKWPNDLIARGAKLGGILIEMRSQVGGATVAVIGFGINVRNIKTVSGEIDQRAIDLSELAPTVVLDRAQVAACVLAGLCPALKIFERDGFEVFAERWSKRDAYANRAVVLALPEQDIRGIARGVDSSGALQIEDQEGRCRSYLSGTLRADQQR